MEEGIKSGNSLAAPLIFAIIVVVQFVPRYIDQQIHQGSMSETEIKLRKEIKRLHKEAGALSQPSTFAKAAKLRRTAANKEKELAKYVEKNVMEKRSSYGPLIKLVIPLKIMTYFLLTFWFWKTPVASINSELLQPIGKLLSWKSGAYSQGKVMVGILPWLALCTKVSKFICGRFVQ